MLVETLSSPAEIYAGGGESITRRTEALSCLGKSQTHAAPIIAEGKARKCIE